MERCSHGNVNDPANGLTCLHCAAKLDAWRDVPITAGLLADIFDAYSGAGAHNLVVATVHDFLRRKV